jgi:hypothetical protein
MPDSGFDSQHFKKREEDEQERRREEEEEEALLLLSKEKRFHIPGTNRTEEVPFTDQEMCSESVFHGTRLL